MNELDCKQLEAISEVTLRKTADVGIENAKANLPYIKKSILVLKDEKGKAAIVISAGPSLHIKNQAKIILKSGFEGTIIAADGALGYCLRNGLIPDFVVSVDPHPTRIVRWFGDMEFEKHAGDDYFTLQDLDPALNKDERERNEELVELVNKHGSKIKAIIATSVAPSVTKRCIETNMDLYWWNPMYDDYTKAESFSRKVYGLTKVPCMITGGNVGTSAWVFAHAILKKADIALIGMDLSYPPSTPLQNTQYYKELRAALGNSANDAYIKIYNPYLKETWYTDPTYYWYKQNFLTILSKIGCATYNCTEGGVLFGEGIIFIPLQNFLRAHMGPKAAVELREAQI